MEFILTVIAWIIIGGVAGWLASMVMDTSAGQTVPEDIAVGIAGGLIGGFILSLLGIGGGFSGFNIVSLLVAFFGAVVLLMVLKMVRGTAQV